MVVYMVGQNVLEAPDLVQVYPSLPPSQRAGQDPTSLGNCLGSTRMKYVTTVPHLHYWK
jgi:hypothetical protein